MKLNKKDINNLLDALEEWFEVVEPKELYKNEIGSNNERYQNLKKRLKKNETL